MQNYWTDFYKIWWKVGTWTTDFGDNPDHVMLGLQIDAANYRSCNTWHNSPGVCLTVSILWDRRPWPLGYALYWVPF